MTSTAAKLTPEHHLKKRVVVVDDNEILLRAWQRILENGENGMFEIFATTSPEAALEDLQLQKADLLITDIVMPRTDGFDLIEHLQNLPDKPRIILTTGYVCDFTRLRLEVGSQDVHVLLKPYNNIDHIREFVQRFLDGDDSLDEEDSLTSLDDARVHLWNL